MTRARPSAGNEHPRQAFEFETWNWNAVVNPVDSGCWSLNHAEPCWFRLAVVRRKAPLLVICGRKGEPFVRIWHAGGALPLFAHTFVVVKPPTGKLNDCATAGFAAETVRIS